jgi:hypothetical protein
MGHTDSYSIVSDILDSIVSDILDSIERFWIHLFERFWIQSFQIFWIQSFQILWIHSFQIFWIQSFQILWIHSRDSGISISITAVRFYRRSEWTVDSLDVSFSRLSFWLTIILRLSLLLCDFVAASPVYSYGGGSAPLRRLFICR